MLMLQIKNKKNGVLAVLLSGQIQCRSRFELRIVQICIELNLH